MSWMHLLQHLGFHNGHVCQHYQQQHEQRHEDAYQYLHYPDVPHADRQFVWNEPDQWNGTCMVGIPLCVVHFHRHYGRIYVVFQEENMDLMSIS